MSENKDKHFTENFDEQNGAHEQISNYSTEEAEVCTYPERASQNLPDNSTYAFRWESVDAPTENNVGAKKSKLWIHTLIMSISFIVAFSILALTLIEERRDLPASVDGVEEETDSEEHGEDTKTIYIKEYDASSGVLMPQEIYSRALPSVVSIKASNDGSQGIGSGFVFDDGGYVATAQHVINGMTDIKVITSTGEEFEAEVTGSDELTDLALLKIDCDRLVPLDFGKSSELLVGDELLAIGTPASLEFAGSMTCGDVSYVRRAVSIHNDTDGTLKKKMTLIQTSAALNPGNSGGPVLNCYGEVVGIVTMKLGNSFDGISFIIPSDGAYGILCDMRDGIELTDAKRAAVATYAARMGILGESFSDGVRLGVRINDFASSECDAAKKLKTGDVIVSMNGKAVLNVSAFAEALSNYAPGDTVSVTVYRSEQLLTFSIILTR